MLGLLLATCYITCTTYILQFAATTNFDIMRGTSLCTIHVAQVLDFQKAKSSYRTINNVRVGKVILGHNKVNMY